MAGYLVKVLIMLRYQDSELFENFQVPGQLKGRFFVYFKFAIYLFDL